MSQRVKEARKGRREFILVRRVVGKSMWPVLEPKQVVVVMRKKQYKAEDVVVIVHDGREKIKRVRSLERGKYDVRCDNPSHSTDSRHFGLVQKEDILGKVIWPSV